jgi:hypothetical protein
MAPHLIANVPGTSEPVSLPDLAAALEVQPETSVVALTASATAPPLLVVDIGEDAAMRLQQAFAGRLTIERDAPLLPGTNLNP